MNDIPLAGRPAQRKLGSRALLMLLFGAVFHVAAGVLLAP